MPFTLRQFGLSAIVLSGAMLVSACGGGNDDPLPGDSSSDPVAKYIGSWISRCTDEGGFSAHIRADFRKVSGTVFHGDVVSYVYLGTSCSGPSVGYSNVLSNLKMTHVGTGNLNGFPTDKFMGSSSQDEHRVLLSIDQNLLRIGDPDSKEDAEGYPSRFIDETLSRL